jgi:hypothetical protein
MRYLLVQGTMPDVFDAIMPIWEDNHLYALMFAFFVLVVTITIMNMLVGVLVGVVNTITAVEKESLMIHFVKDSLLELMDDISADEDKDGKIDRHEFEQLIQVPNAIRAFSQMGVDVVGLVDLADFIFKDSHSSVSYGDFIDLLIQLRGSNQATVKDVVDLRKCVTVEMVQMRSELQLFENKVMAFLEDIFRRDTPEKANSSRIEDLDRGEPGSSSGERWKPSFQSPEGKSPSDPSEITGENDGEPEQGKKKRMKSRKKSATKLQDDKTLLQDKDNTDLIDEHHQE